MSKYQRINELRKGKCDAMEGSRMNRGAEEDFELAHDLHLLFTVSAAYLDPFRQEFRQA
jgi:hypothetical protein